MTYPDPNAVEGDRHLQADPELDLSAGPATTLQKVFTAIASIAIIILVLFGLTHQRDETVQTANAPATQTTGSAPPAAAKDSKNSQQQSGQAPGGGQQGQPQQGSSQGDKQGQPQGQAQTGQGPGNAAPRETTGAGPKPPAGAPESEKSPSGTQK